MLCDVLSADDAIYGTDTGTNTSVLTDLSHRCIRTKHGTAAHQQATSTTSSQHGTASRTYSGQYGGSGGGGGGYFADERQETTGPSSQPGTVGVTLLFNVRQLYCT